MDSNTRVRHVSHPWPRCNTHLADAADGERMALEHAELRVARKFVLENADADVLTCTPASVDTEDLHASHAQL